MAGFNVHVELFLAGTWTDITGDVYVRDRIRIVRGRRDEGARADPARCTLTLNNKSGTYSPRNPRSPFFGLLGRNTALRVWAGTVALHLPGAVGSYADTPSDTALNITTDLDVRVEITPDSWRPAAPEMITARYAAAGDNRSWMLRLLDTGSLQLRWTTDGTSASRHRESTIPVPTDRRRRALRATLDVDNDAGGVTYTFYTADTIDGPWTPLGDPVIEPTPALVFNGTAPLAVGAASDGGVGIAGGINFDGRVHTVQLRNGIDGPVIAAVDFTTPAAHARQVTGATSRVWSLHGTADIIGSIRFAGEVASFPQRWAPSGADVWTPLEAAGILRRLSQGAKPLHSTIYRETLAPSKRTPLAYWPCEDGQGATRIASALDGGPPMLIEGAPRLAAFTAFAASQPLPVLGDGQLTGQVPAYTSTGQAQVRWLMHVSDSGAGDGLPIATIHTTGTITRIEVVYHAGGGLSIRSYGPNNGRIDVVDDSGTIAFDVNSRLLRGAVEIIDNGSDVTLRLVTLDVGASVGSVIERTIIGRAVDLVQSVTLGSLTGNGLGDVAIGHISVHDEVTSIFDLNQSLTAWVGEAAGRRIQRLCAEESIPFTAGGDLDDTQPVGPQQAKTLLELLQAAADVDGGILHETRHQIGLSYTPLRSLYLRTGGISAG